jgi:mannose-6-phosphate isomerase-like protein (cupin superfamily)
VARWTRKRYQERKTSLTMDTPATSLLASKYTKTNIKDIPLEGAVHPMTVRGNSTHFTEITKAVFEPGKGMDWHTHATEDEMMIILQGTGKFYWKKSLLIMMQEKEHLDVITMYLRTFTLGNIHFGLAVLHHYLMANVEMLATLK